MKKVIVKLLYIYKRQNCIVEVLEQVGDQAYVEFTNGERDFVDVSDLESL